MRSLTAISKPSGGWEADATHVAKLLLQRTSEARDTTPVVRTR
jgi:hypothetical protein